MKVLEDKALQKVKVILSVILLLVFGYFFVGQFTLPHNTPSNGRICDVLPGNQWYEIKEDGTKVPFTVPGTTDGDITLETTLPVAFEREYGALCFRGMDMEIFISDIQRGGLRTEDYGWFGDQSGECYVMVSLYPEDAGKKLRVHYEYNSGMIYEVYIGTRFGILVHLFRQYGLELFVGLALLFIGLICLIAAVTYKHTHKKYLEMEHLSIGAILGACWVLSNSVFRQMYTRNIAVMSNMPFLMVMIMPLPFLIFINSLQNNRYRRADIAVSILEITNFVIWIVLFVTGKASLLQSFLSSAVCALIGISVIFVTILIDIKKHLVRSYIYVAVGFAVLAIGAIVQIFAYQFAHNGIFSGVFMAFGLFGFMICSIIHTIKQIIAIRLEANELVHISKAKDDFLANMSHEIRTPLNGILGMDEMILRDTKESRIKKYALEIKSAGNTLLSIINDILDLSKIESGNFAIIEAEYGLASVLNDVLNMTRPRAQKKGLAYDFHVSENIPSVLLGDEIRIRQIMLNIINNAIKYTESGSVKVEVSSVFVTTRDSIVLSVTVTDTGIGIKEEDKDKLFQSFRRLDEKKNRNIEGTGLGLHITYLLLEMMDGDVEFESEYGKGSMFKISVPQQVVNASPIGDFSKAVKDYLDKIETDEVGFVAPEARLLVVDDNELNLEVMEGLLRDTKMHTDYVDSGAKCIEKVRDSKYDCILLDQMMPGLSGEATLKQLQEEDLLKGTPVIALTADAIIGARENYIAMGFTDYLSKPVKYEALEALLRRYVPEEKQITLQPADDLPVMLIWGNDPERLREEKERLEGIYKCVCVVGEKAMEKYMAKHVPDGILHVEASHPDGAS